MLETMGKGILDAMGRSGIIPISLQDAGSSLNTDFRKKRSINRVEAERLQTDFLAGLSNGVLELMISSANAYAMPYASRISDVPLSNSRYLAAPDTVPFYSMVLSGRLPLSSRPVNDEPDIRAAFLRCVEAGVMPCWRLSDDDDALSKDTHFRSLYNLSYQWSGALLRELYAEFKPFLDAAAGRTVIRHDTPVPGVSRTEFDNGVVIWVNHALKAIDINGVTMEPQSCRLERSSA